jgi:hypothetical protein
VTEHAGFIDAIRRAAGHRLVAGQPDEPETKFGDLGGGRGGTAAGRPRPALSHADLNRRIREGARLARQFTIPDGVRLEDFDLDDLYRE